MLWDAKLSIIYKESHFRRGSGGITIFSLGVIGIDLTKIFMDTTKDRTQLLKRFTNAQNPPHLDDKAGLIEEAH